jgi:hypothetical protein
VSSSCPFFECIAEVVQHAHERGIVHGGRTAGEPTRADPFRGAAVGCDHGDAQATVRITVSAVMVPT